MARAKLIELEFLTADTASKQWKLNRTGAYFELNLSWRRKEKKEEELEGKEVLHRLDPRREFQHSGSVQPVDNSKVSCSYFAPLIIESCSDFSPPYKDKKTPYRSKYQKTQEILKPTGVCKANKKKDEAPNIWNIKSEDLGHFSRMEKLYFQAVKRGLIEASEASVVNFLAAGIRAKEINRGDSPRVFMGIIQGNLWQHITHNQEQRALAALKRFRDKDHKRFQAPECLCETQRTN
jgi:hypothetical protein